uniref:Protein-serine/threonine kinase n=1 Tax=Saccharum hybrid cultivar R570 TaxID=131158 RepID=A0A059Q031_9POAL|nr:pyruvate dehydrogenase [Saccharum hybrid cultivar R570]
MASEPVARAVAEEVGRWGSMKQTGVSLRYMMEFGSRPTPRNLLLSAQFLHKELPIRFARRALELESLPLRPLQQARHPQAGLMFGLLTISYLLIKVRDWYLDSFRDIRYFPEVRNRNDELAFTQMINMVKMRHNNVVPTMALGVQQLKKELGHSRKVPFEFDDQIHEFLDRFYMSRIGIRMLIGQHVALHDPQPSGVIGLINTRLSPIQVAQAACEDARAICLREYGSAPDINIYGDPNFTFPYVTHHLHLMLFELVKNSLRAVQERYMNSDKDAPPVRIIVADGEEDVTIKVSDEGGGIPRSGLPRIFTYLYSTAKNPPELDRPNIGVTMRSKNIGVTMAGYGFGLPISRLYARYFGGDLQIISMEGYGMAIFHLIQHRNITSVSIRPVGTDAYLHLSRLGDSEEPLP